MKLFRSVVICLFALSSATAYGQGKSNSGDKGGGPGKLITEFEAADVTLGDNATDVIQSDGLGTYESFADGFEAYSEYDRTEFRSGNLPFTLNLGILVSGDATFDPSGQIVNLSFNHRVNGLTFYDREASFPAPGTTFESSAENTQNCVIFFTAADGNEYVIAADDDSGEISLSGHDVDNDGKNDARSIHVSPSVVWTLYVGTTETREVVVGKGKNQTTETEDYLSWEPVADYTGMSLDLWFDLLGFRVTQFSRR